MNRPTRELIALVGGSLAALAVFFAALKVDETVLFHSGRLDSMPYLAVATAAAAGAAFALAYVLIRRRLSLPSIGRLAVVIFLVPYLATWALGVPRVLTDFTSIEVATYKRLKAEENRVWEVHPIIRYFISFPIAPTLVLTYHEYQLAGLYGEGSWELSFWYGSGSRSIWRYDLWVS
jgi:hypothetical protein